MKGVFDAFRNVRKKNHSEARAIAMNRTQIRSEDIALTELLDFALIDETVNEWLAGTKPEQTSESNKFSRLTDRVLTQALRDGVVSGNNLDEWEKKYAAAGTLSWRTVARQEPSQAQSLERLAASIYGFRPVLICQMSSLVQADLLTSKVSPQLWQRLFEIGVVPVVEHGHAPDVSGRIVCISRDPSDRTTWELMNKLNAFKSELAYADGSVVSGMQDLITQHVSAIGASIYVTRPRLRKVIFDSPERRLAA